MTKAHYVTSVFEARSVPWRVQRIFQLFFKFALRTPGIRENLAAGMFALPATFTVAPDAALVTGGLRCSAVKTGETIEYASRSIFCPIGAFP